jgi:hypothetical protein
MPVFDIIKMFNYSFIRKKIFRREVEASFYSNRKFRLPVIPKIKPENISSFKANYPFRFFKNTEEFNLAARILEKIEPKDEIISLADKILSNQFYLNGEETDLGDSITWNKDYVTGFKWENNLPWKTDPFNTKIGVDIKNVWEVSRFHQGIALGKAYLLTNDEKYTQKLISLINDFSENNPFCASVNWIDSSEAAIRLVNVIYSLSFFIDSPFVDETFVNDFRDFILYHSIFIENNLDYSHHRGSGYLLNLLGLAAAGVLFNNHHYGIKNINFAFHSLEQEIRDQISDDGISYEQSVPYHLISLETFYLSKIILEKEGKLFSEGYNHLLSQMFEVQYNYLRDDKSVPQAGDAISSRIITPGLIDNILDYSTPVAVGAYLFSMETYKTLFPEGTPELLLLFGPGFRDKYSAIKTEPPDKRSKGYFKGGHYFLRSRDVEIFVDGGEIGRNGYGAPGHNDIFSFDLVYKGKQFISDPGTYSFFAHPIIRDNLRSVREHNTVFIDDMQISEFDGAFKIKGGDITRPKLLEWKSNNEEDILAIQHYAYIKLPDPVICKRTFHLFKEGNIFKIKDELFGGAEHHIKAKIHFHPSVLVKKIENNHFSAERDNIRMEIKFHTPSDYFYSSVQEADYSSRYGKLEKTKRIAIHLKEKFPTFFVTDIILL